jgi:DNA polymerase-3 subunit delta
MIKNFEQILQGLKSKEYHPVYFLSGEESFFIDTISDYIADNVLEESEKSFSLSISYGKESLPASVIENALQYPMMASYNVIILKEAQELKKFDDFLPYFEQPNEKSILVICCKRMKLDKRTSVYKALKESKDCCFMESKKVYENKIAPWVDQYLKASQLKITPKASALLIEYLGSDLSKIANELDKLIRIKSSPGTIDMDDIEFHIGISKDYNIFELQNALGTRNSEKVAQITRYYQANSKNNPLIATIGALNSYFTKCYVMENSKKSLQETAHELGLSDWQLRNFKPTLTNYKGKFTKILSLLQAYDLKSKGIDAPTVDEAELIKELLFKLLTC